MEILIVVALIAAVYLWYKFVYSPGKYSDRKRYSSGSSSSDSNFWLGSFGDDSGCDCDCGGCDSSSGDD